MTRALIAMLARQPTALRLLMLAVATLAALGLPWVLYPPVATDVLCWGLFAVSLDLLLGYTGLLSFGHAAFWGSAAYTTGLIALHLGAPFYLAVLGGAVAAALLAAPIGFLAVRRAGMYFAMVTLAFAQMVYFTANQWSSVTGGENGLQAIPRSLFGVDLSNSLTYYYAALPVIVLGLFGAWRVVHSPTGRVLLGIRENPDRVRALGYSTERFKLLIFVISAFLAGLAGGLYAINHGFASLQEVHWTTSGKVTVMTVLGGIGTLWGSLAGATVIVRLEDWLATAGFQHVELITGAIFILVVLLFRRGLWGAGARVFRVSRRQTETPAADGNRPHRQDPVPSPPIPPTRHNS
ncbi:branched-chain amino acid ABC transporter permease [Streptomyces sp. NPDC002668]|uniref:branched-chain amino acid ABC transporter permease n=1 Tax=Streptomyces sp. NPDC002668 TaxID=3154422 RepID=UPI003329A181